MGEKNQNGDDLGKLKFKPFTFTNDKTEKFKSGRGNQLSGNGNLHQNYNKKKQ